MPNCYFYNIMWNKIIQTFILRIQAAVYKGSENIKEILIFHIKYPVLFWLWAVSY